MISHFDNNSEQRKLLHGIISGIIAEEDLYKAVYFYGIEKKISMIFSRILISCRKRNPNSSIIRINAVDYYHNYLVAAIEDYTKELRKQYRSCDMLLMDHFDKIGASCFIMEEFYELFDYHFIRGHPIIIAGSVCPRLINGLPNRVRTQLEGGIIFQVE